MNEETLEFTLGEVQHRQVPDGAVEGMSSTRRNSRELTAEALTAHIDPRGDESSATLAG